MEQKLDIPTVFITGPTASGKTSLAIDVAEAFNGEIICADSRTIYRGMDIGTAKPTKQELARVQHWGIDLVDPNQPYSVYDFKEYAKDKINDIKKRGKIPFVVGGTGLYIDSVLFDYQFGPAADQKNRLILEKMTIEELQERCKKLNIKLPENKQNKRYLIRAIESKDVQKQTEHKLPDNTIVVAIATKKEILRERISSRINGFINEGALDEALAIGRKYGWDNEALTGNIYRLAKLYDQNLITIEQLKNKLIVLDWRLAKRQLTWLKRNEHILWMDLNQAKKYLFDKLALYK